MVAFQVRSPDTRFVGARLTRRPPHGLNARMPGPFRRLRAFRARWRRTYDAVQEAGPRLDEVDARSAAARDASESAGERARHAVAVADGAQAAVDRLGEGHAETRQALSRLERAQARTELHTRIGPTTQWIEETPVPEDVLISVVLPTHDRPTLLRTAVESVVAQRYGRWELLIVDDGETDVDEVVSGFGDPRIRLLRGPRNGVGAARNMALAEARGDLVAYLDDDNRMQPLWLKAVVWAFVQRPDVDVMYGARIVEDTGGIGRRDNLWAGLQFERFHRRRLEEGNYIDLGSLVHRAGLPEASFDEGLLAYGDWDLLLRLTRIRPPMALPVIACSYSTSAPDRLQNHPAHSTFHDTVRARVAASRPLRVLAYNPLMPLLSETYIEDELEALCRVNADLVYARTILPPPNIDMPVERPVYEGLEAALAEYDPDLLFIHWFTFAKDALPTISASGLPFAVRAHSYDFDPEVGAELLGHPNCLGVWTYPHFTSRLPGASALPTIFTSADRMPPPSPVRDLVMSASAGLPKKDFPLLVDAMARIDGIERQILVATAYLGEELPGQVRQMASRHPDPPTVRVDVPRREVFAALSRAAALIYTLGPDDQFGNPMSVVEGLCAGASVILPDRPEARRFAGPAARFYTSADDIVAHVKEIISGGPAIEQEQADNRTYGMRAFADPALGQRFYAELVEALESWRSERRINRPS